MRGAPGVVRGEGECISAPGWLQLPPGVNVFERHQAIAINYNTSASHLWGRDYTAAAQLGGSKLAKPPPRSVRKQQSAGVWR